jgi:steroid delta-isomerase-like uncharacterized protein
MSQDSTCEFNKKVTRRLIEEVANGRDLTVMDELVAEDFVEIEPAPGQGPGREGLRQVFASMHRAFPDLHWQTEEQIAEGNKVVTRFTWSGTHEGEFAGVPATGKTVKVKGIVIDEFEDSVMFRSRILSDDLSLFQQLGAIA